MTGVTDRLSNLFGSDTHRMPPPELADPEEVNQYLQKHLEAQPREKPSTAGKEPMVESPYASTQKAAEDIRTKHKAEFPWLYDPDKGVRWDFDPILLRNLSQGDTWVGLLIQSITKEVAETPWQIVDAENKNETAKRLGTDPFVRETIEKQPDATAEEIHDLLSNPNPDDNWQDIVEMGLSDLLEIGSLSWIKAFPERAYDGDELTNEDANPVHLKPTAPEVWTKDYDSRTGILEGFWQFDKIRSPGGGSQRQSRGIMDPIKFSNAEVVWDDMSPRSNRRYGMPPTLLVQDYLQLLDLTVEQEKQYFSKGSIPSGALVFEGWDREEIREWKEENEENIKGKPHKMLMLAGQSEGVDWLPFSYNYQELQFMERMRWYARVIASVFQVPTAVVGLEPEKINYSTFQGERQNFESNTLGPYLQKFERVINDQIIRPHWGTDYRFEFAPGLSESTRGMISERVRSEFQQGIRTRNEAREAVGLDAVDDEQDGFSEEVGPDDPAGDSDGPLSGLELNVDNESNAAEQIRETLEGVDNIMRGIKKQPEKYDEIDFGGYPEAAVDNARMALEAREETGNPNDCGTRVGWARANQLDNRETLSPETVRRMASFRRHEDNADQGDDGRADCGWLMWKAWGGEEGIAWAERVSDRMDEIDEELEESVTKQDWEVHEPSYDEAEATDEDWDGVDYEDIQAAMDWTVGYDELQPQQKELVNGMFLQSDSGFPAEDFTHLNYEVAEPVNGEVVLREDGLSDARNALSLDTDSPDAMKAQIREVIDSLVEREFPQAGMDPSTEKQEDEPLRETDDWQLFSMQPSDVEALAEEIQDPVSQLWDEILSDESIEEAIESLAAPEEETEKGLTELGRKLRQAFESSQITAQLQDKIQEFTVEQARDALQDSLEEVPEDTEDIDEDAILARIEERDMGFVDSYADRMKEEIRETVADGWDEGKSALEIRDDLMAEAEDFEGYEAERIARDQIQRAQGEARNEFARQSEGMVEVWRTSGDNRVRPAHQNMDGKWKLPSEAFEVEYEDVVREEAFPGDSEEGIQCRCQAILREKDRVDESDHEGVA